MIDAPDAPETVLVDADRVSCEGEGGALGHPRVWYPIPAVGWIDCKYCDRRFVRKGGPADKGRQQGAGARSA